MKAEFHGVKLFADVSKQTNHVGSIVDVRFSVRDIQPVLGRGIS